ncbi:hypothetical protein AB6A40_007368 [Gnathostoma spinigerum]|uniref:Myosin-VIIa n=1 Tax=Gnathostoma spinigerum TaxID=75299 RepID=A0ABD6ETN6_9BILA
MFLQKLEGKAEPSSEAIASFLGILRYMGDIPLRRAPIGTEITDSVFLGALKFGILRDELYCQLMKQLTYNFNPYSEEKGWELMWLCIGLFPPSRSLREHLTQFLRSRNHPIAIDCCKRLQKISKSGQRKYPPHQVEVDAIQHRMTQIFHKIYFPDGSEDAIEVDSATKACDLCHSIAYRIGLRSVEGFALFVRFGEKMISIPESEFFFDFVRQLSDCLLKRHLRKEKVPRSFNYQIFFMRKVWNNVVPGDDSIADLTFHYHQELPKHLRGYHKLSAPQITELAAIILRARTRDDKPAPLAQINQFLGDLIPKDVIKAHSPNEWKKMIIKKYDEQIGRMTSDDAKIAFLKYICRWPTFGSAFFEVKQSSDSALPTRLLIAINIKGVNIIDVVSKDCLVSYPYHSISNWTSGNTYFHMTVGNLIKGDRSNRILLETTLGYKMDDLITSYLKLLLSSNEGTHRVAIADE